MTLWLSLCKVRVMAALKAAKPLPYVNSAVPSWCQAHAQGFLPPQCHEALVQLRMYQAALCLADKQESTLLAAQLSISSNALGG